MKRKFVGLLNKLRTTAWTRIAKKDVDKPNLMMAQQIVLTASSATTNLNMVNVAKSLTDLTASMPDWNTHDTATLSITPTKVKITKHSYPTPKKYPRKKKGYATSRMKSKYRPSPKTVVSEQLSAQAKLVSGKVFCCSDPKCQRLGMCINTMMGTAPSHTRKPSKPVKPRRNVSRSKRFDVLNRDKFRCTYCGLRAKETELHVDHIKAVSKGGSSEMDNLTTACKDCNRGKHAKTVNQEDLVLTS